MEIVFVLNVNPGQMDPVEVRQEASLYVREVLEEDESKPWYIQSVRVL